MRASIRTLRRLVDDFDVDDFSDEDLVRYVFALREAATWVIMDRCACMDVDGPHAQASTEKPGRRPGQRWKPSREVLDECMLTVERCGTFNAAAAEIGVSPLTLRNRLKKHAPPIWYARHCENAIRRGIQNRAEFMSIGRDGDDL